MPGMSRERYQHPNRSLLHPSSRRGDASDNTRRVLPSIERRRRQRLHCRAVIRSAALSCVDEVRPGRLEGIKGTLGYGGLICKRLATINVDAIFHMNVKRQNSKYHTKEEAHAYSRKSVQFKNLLQQVFEWFCAIRPVEDVSGVMDRKEAEVYIGGKSKRS